MSESLGHELRSYGRLHCVVRRCTTIIRWAERWNEHSRFSIKAFPEIAPRPTLLWRESCRVINLSGMVSFPCGRNDKNNLRSLLSALQRMHGHGRMHSVLEERVLLSVRSFNRENDNFCISSHPSTFFSSFRLRTKLLLPFLLPINDSKIVIFENHYITIRNLQSLLNDLKSLRDRSALRFIKYHKS